MKRLFAVQLVLALLGLSAFSQSPTQPQHIEVAKRPGEATTIWFWGMPPQSDFDGIAIENSTNLQGPYADMSLTIPKTDLSVTFPAPDKPTFYRTYTYKTISGIKTKGPSSNVVAISIMMTGLPPVITAN